jgi:hypothetical protein
MGPRHESCRPTGRPGPLLDGSASPISLPGILLCRISASGTRGQEGAPTDEEPDPFGRSGGASNRLRRPAGWQGRSFLFVDDSCRRSCRLAERIRATARRGSIATVDPQHGQTVEGCFSRTSTSPRATPRPSRNLRRRSVDRACDLGDLPVARSWAGRRGIVCSGRDRNPWGRCRAVEGHEQPVDTSSGGR